MNCLIIYRYKFVTLPIVILLILFLQPTPALSQQYQSQDGHFLDANPRIGSLGINPNARLDALVPRINNLYITGNISGGASFQGQIPYQSTNEFSATLGSSTLSNFRRDSIGGANLSSGIHLPQPYLDLSRSITRLEGHNVVATHELFQIPQTVATLSQAAPFTGFNQMNISPQDQPDFSMRIKSPFPDEFDFRRFENPDVNVGLTEKPAWMTEETDTGSSPLTPYQPLGQSPLQNVLEPEDLRVGLLQPLPDNAQPDESNRQLNLPRNQSGETTPPGRPFPEEFSSLNKDQSDSGQAEGLSDENREEAPPSSSILHVQVAPKLNAISVPPKNNAYADYARKKLEYHMSRGEKLMKKGEYFSAANTYDTALIYNINSGPANRAKSHALFATGEFMSSAVFLNKALQVDPAQARKKIDLQSLFAQPASFQKQLKELAKWQDLSSQPKLHFLYGYVLYQSGSAEQAKTALVQARSSKDLEKSVDYLLDSIANPDKISSTSK
jgi:tetratricopeptide (TPR) repeat protein